MLYSRYQGGKRRKRCNGVERGMQQMNGLIYKKTLIIGAFALLLVVSGIFLKHFVIGEPVDRAQVYCEVSLSEEDLQLRIQAAESGAALCWWKFRQDGNTLLISARKVPVSALFDKGDYETSIERGTVDTVLFGGQEIWRAL